MQTEAIFDGIAERIQLEISQAKRSIFIAVAWFTNKKLFNELLKKAQSGCSVSLIISNDSINRFSDIDYNQLTAYNSKVFKIGNGNSDLMHNKFCIIDYSTVITGSYNWSYKAEHNYENVIITNGDTSLAEQFIAEFNNIRKQYYPETEKEEVIFPLDKIIKRLEILKNYIALEDTDELEKEISKLKEFDFNSNLSDIISVVKSKEYSAAINKIQNFISDYQQLSIWVDLELAALKLEIKNLENKLNAYDNEKIELEKLLADFQHKHAAELGDLILEILRLRKIKYKENKEKYEEAENDEHQYRSQINLEKGKIIFDLTELEKTELKKKFRRATILCHPDKVGEEFKEAAEKIFIELKQAYDRNDLKRVSEILEELEKGNYFKTKSETTFEKDLLKTAVERLRKQIETLEKQIISIKESETYKTVLEIKDWPLYFRETKEQLQEELKQLKIDI